MARSCVNDHCPFNSDEANDGCLIIPEDIADNMAGECPKKIVVTRVDMSEEIAVLTELVVNLRNINSFPAREIAPLYRKVDLYLMGIDNEGKP